MITAEAILISVLAAAAVAIPTALILASSVIGVAEGLLMKAAAIFEKLDEIEAQLQALKEAIKNLEKKA